MNDPDLPGFETRLVIFDYEIEGLLIPAQYFARNISSKKTRQISASVMSIFDSWIKTVTASHADHYVQTSDINSVIAIAFKLFLEEHPEFTDVLLRYGLYETFAVIGLGSSRSTPLRALLNLNRFLTKKMKKIAEQDSITAKTHKRTRTALDNGRAISATRRSEKRINQDEKIRRMAFEYWISHPSANVSAVADYLAPRVYLSPQTIIPRIRGIKANALAALDTSITQSH